MSEESTPRNAELRVLLVPWHDSNLLLPNSVVVEVLRYPEITPDADENREWIEGRFQWRNLSLPLISLDQLLELSAAKSGEKKRVLVCHLLSDEADPAFVGIVVQGMPRLMNLEEAALEVTETDSELEARPVIAEVTMEETSALIPDLEKVAQLMQSA